MPPRGRLVYSTDDPPGTPERRRHPPAVRGALRSDRATAGRPGTIAAAMAPDTVYVERTRKGRGGKTVTLILNLPGDEAGKQSLLKTLKTTCGAGGTLKDGVLEIQGDHRDRIVAHLESVGLKVKPRGG